MTDRHCSRRRLLALGVVAGTAGAAGCVTTSLSVRTPGIEQSSVFESFEVTDSVSLAGRRVRVSVALAPDATTTQGVTSLSLVTGDGESYWTGELDTGQTSETFSAPIGTQTTLFALDSSGAVVDRQSLRVVGTSYP